MTERVKDRGIQVALGLVGPILIGIFIWIWTTHGTGAVQTERLGNLTDRTVTIEAGMRRQADDISRIEREWLVKISLIESRLARIEAHLEEQRRQP